MTVTLPLQAETILKGLGQSIFARNLLYHESIGSTNVLAYELGAQGAPEGTLVLAEYQSAGKGRMGRGWLAERYLNLLFSILLRPRLPPNQIFSLTMILALATMEEIRKRCGLQPMIKWPNDIYVGRKKLGGILTEFSVKGKVIEYAVLGLGLNVNWNPGEGDGLLYPATSILAETGHRLSRAELLIDILKSLERYYGKVLQGEFETFYKRWNEHSLIIGRAVQIESGTEKIRGKALRIEPDGSLVIEDREGKERRILSGDVFWLTDG
ncbi:MAG: biotin--[acetyl-CoA-carboxylase] ligase [Pseudomonadota bacterium]